MRAFVTGAAGFIGSELVLQLVEAGCEVMAVDKLTYAGHLSSLASVSGHSRFGFVEADICNGAAMAALMAQFEPDAVFHLAAESHVDRSITGAGAFIHTNIVGTFELLQAARGYCEAAPAARREAFRFLHVSTDEVFGSLGPTGAFTETTAYDPRSPYSASKAASDHLVRAWGHTYGLPVLVSNCSNNFGPRQLPEKLVPLMILNGLDGLELPVYGDGRNVRDWLYVGDHARALRLIVERGRVGETYAVGGGCELENLAMVEAICAELDRARPARTPHRDLIRFVTDRPGHDRRYAIDSTKIRTELGWAPAASFVDALAATVDWYLANPDWWGPLRKQGHGLTRLGLDTGGGKV